MIQIMSI